MQLHFPPQNTQMDRSWCLFVLAMLFGVISFTSFLSLVIVSSTNENVPNLLGLILMGVFALIASVGLCITRVVYERYTCATGCGAGCGGCCLRRLIYDEVEEDSDEFI